MGRLCARALRLFDAVVFLHDVRCQSISVLQYFYVGSPGVMFPMLFGRRISPGGWYLTYLGDKLAFTLGFDFYHREWFPVEGGYLTSYLVYAYAV